VVSFMPRPLYPQGKSAWYPLDRRLGGPQSRSGRGGEEKNSQPPPEIEPQNPNHPACDVVFRNLLKKFGTRVRSALRNTKMHHTNGEYFLVFNYIIKNVRANSQYITHRCILPPYCLSQSATLLLLSRSARGRTQNAKRIPIIICTRGMTSYHTNRASPYLSDSPQLGQQKPYRMYDKPLFLTSMIL
jgi:hypothetical protein